VSAGAVFTRCQQQGHHEPPLRLLDGRYVCGGCGWPTKPATAALKREMDAIARAYDERQVARRQERAS
jgi:hypothetical protein